MNIFHYKEERLQRPSTYMACALWKLICFTNYTTTFTQCSCNASFDAIFCHLNKWSPSIINHQGLHPLVYTTSLQLKLPNRPQRCVLISRSLPTSTRVHFQIITYKTILLILLALLLSNKMFWNMGTQLNQIESLFYNIEMYALSLGSLF